MVQVVRQQAQRLAPGPARPTLGQQAAGPQQETDRAPKARRGLPAHDVQVGVQPIGLGRAPHFAVAGQLQALLVQRLLQGAMGVVPGRHE